MRYPALLEPTAMARFTLPDGRVTEIPKATPAFRLWQGEKPIDTYGGKAVLECHGKPAFAELAIVWSFMEVGWSGVWIDTFKHRYLSDYWPPRTTTLLPGQTDIISQLAGEHGARPWDVLCWMDEQVIFVEAKRLKRDRVRDSQLWFLQNALDRGLSSINFLLVEWDAA